MELTKGDYAFYLNSLKEQNPIGFKMLDVVAFLEKSKNVELINIFDIFSDNIRNSNESIKHENNGDMHLLNTLVNQEYPYLSSYRTIANLFYNKLHDSLEKYFSGNKYLIGRYLYALKEHVDKPAYLGYQLHISIEISELGTIEQSEIIDATNLLKSFLKSYMNELLKKYMPNRDIYTIDFIFHETDNDPDILSFNICLRKL